MKKCNHTPYRYITLHYLVCSKCKKKIRKLKPEDRGNMVHAGIIPIPIKLIKKYATKY